MFLRSKQVMAPLARRNFSVKVGDAFPSATVSVVKCDTKGDFASEIVDASEYLANKNVVVVGYPGAFTPTCMSTHLPEYIAQAQKIKDQGADEIIALSVNDPFVVTAFAKFLDGKHLVNFIADGNGELTKALGLGMDLSAVQLGEVRSKRFSMIIKRGSVVEFNNEEGPSLSEKSAAATILK